MTDGDETPTAASNAPAKPKRARKRASGNGVSAAPRKRASKKAAPKPKGPAPAAAPAKPAIAPAPALSEIVMSQTAESLAALSSNLASAMTRANQVFSTAFLEQSKDAAGWRPDPLGVQTALNEVWSRLALQPETLREAHGQLWRRYGDIWQRHAAQMITGLTVDDAEPPRDKRFRDPEWRSNPMFSIMRETYLATAAFVTDLVQKADGVEEEDKRKAAFFIKQAVDAASPSNFLMSNPTALRALLETHGESLKKGVDQLAEDLKRGHGTLAITQADLSAFQVGVNVATTPGKVVFRNRLFELLQYAPTTDTVREVPLLIFPPWINKFYILDLQPKNSMIKWLTNRGYTVFLVSWVNPDEDLAEATFEDYMQEGVYAAVRAVEDATGQTRINAVGYCIGGTLLAATLAHMAKTGDARIQSATFFASQADFVHAGDLKVFTDEAGLRYLEDKMEASGGVLDANTMAATFNALRANDLVWNYVVDNYYLGKEPPPFDLLYWNADQTRMPKALHLFYLRKFYKENALAKGELEVLGETLSLKDVTIPIFMQSSREDHIAPCASVHRSAQAFGGPVEFIVAGSGHIAGVINHPDAQKYQFWIAEHLGDDAEAWFENATETKGSWWPSWDAWLKQRSGSEIPARTPGDGKLQTLGDAPGEYVKVRS
jgi:polyhydroxyalkanoate synthase subunit PhaC